MSGAAKVLVAIVVGVTLMLTLGLGVAAASIVHGGTIAVEVQEHDASNVSVHAPAALIDLALLFIPDRSLSLALKHADVDDPVLRDEIAGTLPALRGAWRELAEAPDFTMVEVSSHDLDVQVEKRGKHVVIHVDADDGQVDVKVPLRTVSRALRKL